MPNNSIKSGDLGFEATLWATADILLGNLAAADIAAHGGYEQLLSFQKARIVYDGTVRFCDRFVDQRSRTHDQMVQGARSGKQNILEGSQASGTSKETEIKLRRPHGHRFSSLSARTAESPQ